MIQGQNEPLLMVTSQFEPSSILIQVEQLGDTDSGTELKMDRRRIEIETMWHRSGWFQIKIENRNEPEETKRGGRFE